MNYKIWIIIILIIFAILVLIFTKKKKYDFSKLVKPKKSQPIRYSNINDMLGDYEDLVKSHKIGKNRKSSLGEFICRKTLETIFDEPFPNKRYRFLKNPETGCPLELDGYNEFLRLAFEFQGDQHSTFPNKYQKTEADKKEFLKQLRRDKFKKEKCKQMGINLLLIYDEMEYHKIPQYIAAIIPERLDSYRKDLFFKDLDL